MGIDLGVFTSLSIAPAFALASRPEWQFAGRGMRASVRTYCVGLFNAIELRFSIVS
jgi:hypothetical protein